MNTKRLTEAAMLSSLFVVLSVFAISTGIAYSIYLDMIVPVLITLIYMRVGMKFTLLSASTSLLIVVLAFGDIVTGIWMSQGMILGFICAYFISKKQTILDDIFYSSILATFVVVLIDVYFSKLTGYSFMKEFNSYTAFFPNNAAVLKISFYVFVATVPVSTVIVVYFASLFIGSRLKILDSTTKQKYKIIKNYKKVGAYLCCSSKTYFMAMVYLVLVTTVILLKIKIKWLYLDTVIYSIAILSIYFLIKDSFSFVSRYLYNKSNSAISFKLLSFFMLYLLLTNFKIMAILLILSSTIINLALNLREKHIDIIDRYA